MQNRSAKLDYRIGLVANYERETREALNSVRANTLAGKLPYYKAVFAVIGLLAECRLNRKRVFLVGNGGSAAICSEMAARLVKFTKLRAAAFNDFVSMSGMANDFGWTQVFAQPLRTHAQREDLLIAISSSGQSPNIREAVKTARELDCRVTTLSGFAPDNPLRGMGDYNFYVNSTSYRHVERSHLWIMDCIHDLFLEICDGKIDLEGRRNASVNKPYCPDRAGQGGLPPAVA